MTRGAWIALGVVAVALVGVWLYLRDTSRAPVDVPGGFIPTDAQSRVIDSETPIDLSTQGSVTAPGPTVERPQLRFDPGAAL